MIKLKFSSIIKTFIISAFTIAIALIWKEVIFNSIKYFFPKNTIFYEFLAALVATLIAIILIYILLKTEYGAEVVIKKLGRKKK